MSWRWMGVKILGVMIMVKTLSTDVAIILLVIVPPKHALTILSYLHTCYRAHLRTLSLYIMYYSNNTPRTSRDFTSLRGSLGNAPLLFFGVIMMSGRMHYCSSSRCSV